MNQQKTVIILEAVQSGALSVAEATLKLKMEPLQDLGSKLEQANENTVF